METSNIFSFEKVYSVFEKAFHLSLNELSPKFCVKNNLKLIENGRILQISNQKYSLENSSIHVIAVGKAAISMVEGAEEVLENKIVGGIASVPFESQFMKKSKISFFPGAKNNLPDQAAAKTAQKIENYVKNLEENNLVLFLISGGASALLPAPVSGISLEEKLNLTKLLASNGATIQELNTVRIALSRLKGGKLSKLVKGQAVGLIISDIIGNPIELIGSGPTVPQKVSNFDALKILKNRCSNKIPENVENYLSSEVSDNSDFSPNIQNLIILSNDLLVQKIVEKIENCKFPKFSNCSIMSTKFEGDATKSGFYLADVALNENVDEDSWNIKIYAGETTVSFQKMPLNNAKGGRNQEMALAFLKKLIENKIEEKNQKNFCGIACFGTDGQDGPTDSAGAFCSYQDLEDLTKDDLEKLKQKVDSHLLSKTSYFFWESFNFGKNHLKFGKTGNNLMDIYTIFSYPNKL